MFTGRHAEKNVCGLEVAVDQSLLMDISSSFQYLGKYLNVALWIDSIVAFLTLLIAILDVVVQSC